MAVISKMREVAYPHPAYSIPALCYRLAFATSKARESAPGNECTHSHAVLSGKFALL